VARPGRTGWCLRVCEAVYEGTFDDPKTDAGVRVVPLSEVALQFIAAWRQYAKKLETIGSSGWIRTSNPPVNSLMQVVGLVGSSCR
jgi:hypothetical protein